MKRNTTLRSDPDKIRAWKARSSKKMRKFTTKLCGGLHKYRELRTAFLRKYRICPITGEPTTEIHHSAGRIGGWLLLRRYWIAVSQKGHKKIHQNMRWAESVGLVVRIHSTFNAHLDILENSGESLTEPVFYETWNGESLTKERI